MTSPLSPEAVAQMVAALRASNHLVMRPVANETAWGAADMITTLAAENATLRHDRDVAVVNKDVLRIAMDTMRAERDDLKSAMAPTPDAELDAFVDFMCGAGEFDGAWFGDAHHSLSGHFWWRTRLRKTIATLRASEAAALERTATIEDALSDPIAVHANMLRGTIAMPSFANIKHLYAADFAALTPTADKEPKT